MSSTAALPERTERLFPGVEASALRAAAGRNLLFAGILEDGDGEDLRWLTAEVAGADLAAWFAGAGSRKLSRRSRAYWRLVLGAEPGPPAAAAAALWPLA